MGVNIFKEKSFATNSSKIFANETGVFSAGKYFQWRSELGEEVSLSNSKINELKDKYHALLTVTELYLRSQKAQNNNM